MALLLLLFLIHLGHFRRSGLTPPQHDALRTRTTLTPGPRRTREDGRRQREDFGMEPFRMHVRYNTLQYKHKLRARRRLRSMYYYTNGSREPSIPALIYIPTEGTSDITASASASLFVSCLGGIACLSRRDMSFTRASSTCAIGFTCKRSSSTRSFSRVISTPPLWYGDT